MIRRDKNLTYLKKVCTDYFGEQKQIVLKTKIDPENEKKKKNQNNIQKQKAMSHPLVSDAIEIFDGKLIDVKLL
jgi:DNA polymerase-3 subunit gamma/tau